MTKPTTNRFFIWNCAQPISTKLHPNSPIPFATHPIKPNSHKWHTHSLCTPHTPICSTKTLNSSVDSRTPLSKSTPSSPPSSDPSTSTRSLSSSPDGPTTTSTLAKNCTYSLKPGKSSPGSSFRFSRLICGASIKFPKSNISSSLKLLLSTWAFSPISQIKPSRKIPSSCPSSELSDKSQHLDCKPFQRQAWPTKFTVFQFLKTGNEYIYYEGEVMHHNQTHCLNMIRRCLGLRD